MKRYFAVHMKNDKTGEKRIQKISAENVDEATRKSKCGYGTGWSWTGSEPFTNISEDNVIMVSSGWYKYIGIE